MKSHRLSRVGFRRALGPFDATMVVIGGIIGSGIFINPYIVAQRLDTSPLVLGAWVAGGLIALAGAFAYAELGAIFPKAGGQYVYLRDGWHPLVGFMYGWALLLLIESGAIAAVAITFATYALRLVGPAGRGAGAARHRGDRQPVARELLRRQARQPRAQRARRAEGRCAGHHHRRRRARAIVGRLVVRSARRVPAPTSALVAFGAALVPILFAYGGWQNANYIAEEIDNPRRNLPLSLLVGTLAVVLIYVTVNVVYLRALGLEGLAGRRRRRRRRRRSCSGRSAIGS